MQIPVTFLGKWTSVVGAGWADDGRPDGVSGWADGQAGEWASG